MIDVARFLVRMGHEALGDVTRWSTTLEAPLATIARSIAFSATALRSQTASKTVRHGTCVGLLANNLTST